MLVDEYIDDSSTGTPALSRLRADLAGDLFDTIYFNGSNDVARELAYQIIVYGGLLKLNKQAVINRQRIALPPNYRRS